MEIEQASEVERVNGVVESIRASMCRGEVVPAIRQADTVPVGEVEGQSKVGIESGKTVEEDFLVLEKGVGNVDVGGVVVHIGESRTFCCAIQWDGELGMCREELVRPSVQGCEVVTHASNGQEVDKRGG